MAKMSRRAAAISWSASRIKSRSIVVRVNDRGPYHGGRVIDLSKRVADALDFRRFGTANVKVDYLRPAGIAGSDDRQLIASLRTDGSPADLDGGPGLARTMIAAITPAPQSAPPPFPTPRQPEIQPAPTASPALAMASTQRPPEQRPIPNLGAQPVAFEPEEGTTAIARSARGGVPLPPSRPLDLATIPGASVPIAAPRRTGFAPAPGGTATFFAPFPPHQPPRKPRGPFGTLDTTGLVPLRN